MSSSSIKLMVNPTSSKKFFSERELIDYIKNAADLPNFDFDNFLSLGDNRSKLIKIVIEAITKRPDMLKTLFSGGDMIETLITEVVTNHLKPNDVTEAMIDNIINSYELMPGDVYGLAFCLAQHGKPRLISKLKKLIPTTANLKKYVSSTGDAMSYENYNKYAAYQSIYYGYLNGLLHNSAKPLTVIKRDMTRLFKATINSERVPFKIRDDFNASVRDLNQSPTLSNNDRIWTILAYYQQSILYYKGTINTSPSYDKDYVDLIVDLNHSLVSGLLHFDVIVVPSKELTFTILHLVLNDDELFGLMIGINRTAPLTYLELTQLLNYLATYRSRLDYILVMTVFIDEYDQYLPPADDPNYKPLTKSELNSIATLLTLRNSQRKR